MTPADRRHVFDEELIELEGPVGRCSSTAAVDIAGRLAAKRDPRAQLRRVYSSEGISDDGSATRWELRFDLPGRMAELVAIVTFTYGEEDRSFGDGVASLSETRFPPPGSELERMAVSEGLSRRRIKGIWRQTLAGRHPLELPLPDASEVLRFLREHEASVGEVRRLDAGVSRSGRSRWIVTGSGGSRHVAWTHGPAGGLTLVPRG